MGRASAFMWLAQDPESNSFSYSDHYEGAKKWKISPFRRRFLLPMHRTAAEKDFTGVKQR
jgi:hypothetical protein